MKWRIRRHLDLLINQSLSQMETASLSDGTGTGTFFIIESMEQSEAKDKTIELNERCGEFLKKNRLLEEENARLRKQLRTQAILMDQNILVNDKRLRSFRKKAHSAENGIKEISSKLKVHNNPRTSIPTMKMLAESLRAVADNLVKEDDEVDIVFGDDILRKGGSSSRRNSTGSTSEDKKKGEEVEGNKRLSLATTAGRRKSSIDQIPRSGMGSSSTSSNKKMRR